MQEFYDRCYHKLAFTKMIDRESVNRILDAADIVDVVSDFVTLKKRGSNYIGICPFHDDRTPSFSVSRTRGIYKCFSCGEAGSAVNFIMKHEKKTYYEALKYLAKKYNIEIVERELTDKERQEQSERENLLIINEFAMKRFEHNLFETQEGRNIGLSYFYERGFNDAIIKKFNLGYSLDSSSALQTDIKANGYNIDHAIETGLCAKSQDRIYDRFKGRVMFPVLNISGKVIAFGGRTLHPDRDKAKYVNSPESIIYKKSNELYGLYQAKKAIEKNDKCYLVEGYTDVLSMHQAGIENVVASSGTSLTDGQIRLVGRFTKNITVLYDGDAAGIKASLRGIDMLLAAGMNIKVLLLPDGDDPDSFAKKHNATEFTEYIKAHETDFIIFKTNILLQGLEDDPIQRAKAISEIIKTISVIPDVITRSVYVKECANRFEMEERVLTHEVAKRIREREANAARRQQHQLHNPNQQQPAQPDQPSPQDPAQIPTQDSFLKPFEKEVIRYIVKYGMVVFATASDTDGNNEDITVTEYVLSELTKDNMTFSTSGYKKLYEIAVSYIQDFKSDYQAQQEDFERTRKILEQDGIEAIRNKCDNLDMIQREEAKLQEQIEEKITELKQDYQASYLFKRLASDSDDSVRQLATDFAEVKYELSKFHSKHAKLEQEIDKLNELIPISILTWKDAIVAQEINDLTNEMRNPNMATQQQRVEEIFARLKELYSLRSQFAKILGDRVIIPQKNW